MFSFLFSHLAMFCFLIFFLFPPPFSSPLSLSLSLSSLFRNHWVSEISKVSNAPCILLGTKKDLRDNQETIEKMEKENISFCSIEKVSHIFFFFFFFFFENELFIFLRNYFYFSPSFSLHFS